MSIKTIPLNRLEADLRATLDECVNTGDAVVVEMPGNRLVAIQALDPAEDDTLIDDLLESNPAFRAKIAKSKDSPRKPFKFGGQS
jgi:hypothetical protein